MEKDYGIKVEGHVGTWYVIEDSVFKGVPVYMLESEIYGDAADHLIIDEYGNLLIEDACNSLDEELLCWMDTDEEKEWFEKKKEEFGVQVITHDCFYSQGFYISTTVFRANFRAYNEYLDGTEWNDRLNYDTYEEWEEYHKEKVAIREEWKNKIYKALGYEITDDMGASITQDVSEIFTAVIMKKPESAATRF